MISVLKRIESELSKANHDIQVCVDSLKTVSSRWSSIITSFLTFPSYLQSLHQSFPDLQSKLELEQLSICDSLLAEITKGFVFLEQTLTNARSEFAKVKQNCRAKDLSIGWEFPPTDVSFGDFLLKTGKLIDEAALALETQRLALYRLNNEEESLNPKAIERFLTAWT
jgi:hypothetical protein